MNRIIPELLYVLEQEFKKHRFAGLCTTVGHLYHDRKITIVERDILYLLIYVYRPKYIWFYRTFIQDGGYYWKQYSKEPRFRWIEEQANRFGLPLRPNVRIDDNNWYDLVVLLHIYNKLSLEHEHFICNILKSLWRDGNILNTTYYTVEALLKANKPNEVVFKELYNHPLYRKHINPAFNFSGLSWWTTDSTTLEEAREQRKKFVIALAMHTNINS